jgi:hypothetical protein
MLYLICMIIGSVGVISTEPTLTTNQPCCEGLIMAAAQFTPFDLADQSLACKVCG